MRIVFMGTPEFAVPSLDILLKNKFNVVGVITSTDKYGGRNNSRLIESDVKRYAQSKGLNILQPKNLKDPYFIKELKDLEADLQIVVAFRMLPEIVWSMPPHGTYNLHGSLLPKYRGAAPINWAIINGDKETGVTSFKLKHEIDTGDIFLQKTIQIEDNETAGQLHDKMKEHAAQVILKTVKAIDKGEVDLSVQKNEAASKAPKIFREHCEINWEKPTNEVYNLIRGLSPYPTAWTTLDNKTFKIFKAEKSFQQSGNIPGSILTDNKSYLHYATSDGYIECLEVQLQGKKKMDVRSFLNGYSLG